MQLSVIAVNILYAVIGVVLMYVSYRLIDRLTPQVDFPAELQRGNVAVAIFIYGFIIWTFYISTVDWKSAVPDYTFVGLKNWIRMFGDRRFRDFTLGTLFGIFPVTVIYTYFASALVEGVAGAREEALKKTLLAAGALLVIVVLPTVLQRVAAKLQQKGTP